MPDPAVQRELMVKRQIAGRGIVAPAVLEAFRVVPREQFVPPDLAGCAYEDRPLSIGAGQTISQPYIVALMIDAAGVGRDFRVLEVGAGSGYAAAVVSRIAREVVAVERHAELAAMAADRLARLCYDNVRIVAGDGSSGWPDAAPFDAILVAAAGSHVPQSLIDQLTPEGRLVMPIGSQNGNQQLVRVTRSRDGAVRQEELGGVRFVPLIGEEGWTDG